MSVDGQKKKILIIEDEATQRILAKEFLENAGYRVRLSEDGRHGLNMANKIQPDLIILDLMLPSLDGYSLCTVLKESEQTANIPIILVTASKEQDVIQRGLEAGADDFVTKPVDWQFLEDRVSFVLSQADEKRAIDAKLALLRPQDNETEKFEREELTSALQTLRNDMERASTKSVEAEEQHTHDIQSIKNDAKEQINVARASAAEELRSVRATASDELGVVRAVAEEQLNRARTAAAEDLAKAQAFYSQESNRLKTEFKAKLEDQNTEFFTQLAAVEEQQELEKALALEANNKPNSSSDEISQRTRAIWNIVGNSCELHDEILSTMIDSQDAEATEGSVEHRYGKVIEQAEQLAHSVQQLKKLARLMTEQASPSSDVFEVNEFITGLAERLTQIAARNQVTINVNGLPDASNICADPQRMRHAMTLLSINALRSTPHAGVITIGASQDDAGAIRLSITDTGAGLSPDERDGWQNCLDKAWSMSGGRKAVNDLYIPIVMALVRQQGGQLEIDSQQGQGSSFSLVLPSRDDADKAGSPSDLDRNEKVA